MYKYKIGQSIFLKTDPEQLERIITGIHIRPNGVSYSVVLETNESYHYEFELTENRDVVKASCG